MIGFLSLPQWILWCHGSVAPHSHDFNLNDPLVPYFLLNVVICMIPIWSQMESIWLEKTIMSFKSRLNSFNIMGPLLPNFNIMLR